MFGIDLCATDDRIRRMTQTMDLETMRTVMKLRACLECVRYAGWDWKAHHRNCIMPRLRGTSCEYIDHIREAHPDFHAALIAYYA